MFKKAVFLCLLSLLMACQSQPRETANTPAQPPAAPHLHIQPLPSPPPPLPHQDFNAVVELGAFTAKQPTELTLVLQYPNGTAAQYADLEKTHGERTHVMLIDSSLTDYQHLHPQPTRQDGLAIFTIPFTPAEGGEYVLFADVTLKSDHTQRFLSTHFPVKGMAKAPHFEKLSAGKMTTNASSKNLTFSTELDPPLLRAGQEAMLNITVKDENGALFRQLEPLMQAFAHLIGFSENREYIVHTHPMGRPVTAENARGGPNLMFHITFPTSGYYRLFLQVHVHGETVVVPFDVLVAP